MQTRARLVLLVALVLGIAGDYLLRAEYWRLGFTFFILLAAAGVALVGGRGQRDRMLMLSGVVLAALGLAIRDSQWLFAVDLLSVLCSAALVVWLGSGKAIADLTVVQAVRAAALAPLTLAFGGVTAVRDGADTDADAATQAARARQMRALIIGAVLAGPPLLIVAALLGQSDQQFEQFIDRIGEFLAKDAIQHAIVVAVLAWAAAGWLRGATGGAREIRVPEEPRIGAPFLTVGVALYGLTALLALYMGLQLRTLYGGSEYLMDTVGLTAANYARRGFFELVVASGIVLATLVAAEWALADDDADGRKRFRHVGTALVVLVAMLLVSAAARMKLYIGGFGLSVDRAIATAVMVWLGGALVTFALTTLLGRTRAFAPSLLAVTVAWVIAVNTVNLEAMIVRVNVARALRGEAFEGASSRGSSGDAVREHGFDAKYHARLSADALPALLQAAPTLPAAECQVLAEELRTHWRTVIYLEPGKPRTDWRGVDLAQRGARAWFDAGALTPCAAGG